MLNKTDIMKRLFILVFALSALAFYAFADGESEYRSKNYPDGGIMYDGHFIGDRPLDVTRYYKSGRIQSVQIFDTNGNSSIKMFNENATLFAEGGYKGKNRDGVWKFYSSKGTIAALITYSNGQKDGQTIEYFESGVVLDSMNYSLDILEGERSQYYQNGQLLARFSYKGGVPNGYYVSYFDSGDKDCEGNFVDGEKDGVWKYYDASGAVTEYKFKKGKCKKFDDALKKESVDSDVNTHIAEPSLDNF